MGDVLWERLLRWRREPPIKDYEEGVPIVATFEDGTIKVTKSFDPQKMPDWVKQESLEPKRIYKTTVNRTTGMLERRTSTDDENTLLCRDLIRIHKDPIIIEAVRL